MTDLAWVGLGVDGRPVDRANQSLTTFARRGREADASARGFTRSAGGMAASASRIQGAVALAAAALGSLVGSVRVLSEFDTSMAQVAAITRATSDELGAMRDVAADLGSTTEFTAAQAAGGLRFLGMAGFEASEAIAAIPAVLDLATAASMDLAQAADVSSNIMSAFGIAAQDAADVADVLAAASSRANTDVTQLGSAMAMVGPVASALDIELSDAASAIGVLSDAGIQGTAAGTGLRRVLSSLANPTGAAATALQSLGVELESVNPATTELTDIVDILAASGLSAADALTIFGDRGGPAILALVSQNDRLRELTGELANVEGEASRMADTMRDQLGGDLQSLWSSVQGLIIALGDAGLTAALRGVIQAVTGFVRAVSSIVDVVGTATNAIGGLVGGIFEIETAESRVADAMSRVETSVDNSTIAMGDQIRQATRLEAALGQGNVVTLEAARVHLESARARLADIDAMRAQSEMEARQASGVDELYRRMLAAREVLRRETSELTAADIRDMEAYGSAYTSTQAEMVRDAERTLAGLTEEYVDLQSELSGQNFISAADAERARDLAAAIELSEQAIAEARDGMVDYNGAAVTGVELSDRLGLGLGAAAREAGSLSSSMSPLAAFDLSGLNSQVAFLAQQLGLSANEAIRLNSVLPGSGGAASEPAGLSFGLGDVNTQNQGDFGSENLGFGVLPDVRRFVDRSGAVDVPLPGGAGGGGGGGGTQEVTAAYRAAEQAIRAAETASVTFGMAQAELQGMLEAGSINSEQYAGAVAELEEQFSNADLSSANLEQSLDSISDAMARAIVQGEDMGDALAQVFQQIAQDLISSGIRDLLGGLFNDGGGNSGDGLFGNLFGNLFGGFRADGGPVSAGKAYVVGERGPEIYAPASSGVIIPNHAMGGGSGGGSSQKLDVSVSIDGEGSIRAFVRNEAGQVLAESAPTLTRQAVSASQAAFRNTKAGWTP